MTQEVQQARREAGPWVERLARLGYFAKGVVYVAIGLLALQAAFTAGGAFTDKQGALQEIVRQPFGTLVLVVMLLGFAGYGIWQLIRAFFDSEAKGDDVKGLFKRVQYFGAGVIYVGLAYIALQILLGNGGGSGGSSSEAVTAQVMQYPVGRWLVGLVGAGIIIGAIVSLYVAWSEKFMGKFTRSKLSEEEWELAVWSGKLGYTARSVVLAVIGWFLIRAAWNYDPEAAGGMSEALQTLSEQPYGPWLLGLVAAGLILYGLFGFVQGRYRDIHV